MQHEYFGRERFIEPSGGLELLSCVLRGYDGAVIIQHRGQKRRRTVCNLLFGSPRVCA